MTRVSGKFGGVLSRFLNEKAFNAVSASNFGGFSAQYRDGIGRIGMALEHRQRQIEALVE